MSGLVPKVIHVFPGLRPGGGPTGYAFYLQQALTTLEGAENLIKIVVPSGVRQGGDNPQSLPSWRSRLIKKLPRWLAGVLLGGYTTYLLKNALHYFGFTHDQVDNLKQAKVVVFHSYWMAFSYMNNYNVHPGQVILLMPHSPTDQTAEMIENWRVTLGDSAIWNLIYKGLVDYELETFRKVRGVIVPCRRALEGYFHALPGGRALFEKLPIYEIKTGVHGLNAVRTRSDVRRGWGIPPDAKIVGYFGRKHPHKGFDLFVQMAELAYKKGYTDIWFVSAGKGSLHVPKSLPNYLDLGYLTEELADAVAAVDLVVVPNRVSYFDLFVLEAMSLGKVVLTSRIGGSVCFSAPGVLFVEDITAESFLQNIEKLLYQDELLKFLGEENKKVFEEEYNLLAFAKRHLSLAQALLGGRH